MLRKPDVMRPLKLSFPSLVILGYIAFFSGLWIRNEFGYISFQQFVFTVGVSTSGLLKSDPKLVKAALLWCVGFPLLAYSMHVIFFSKKFSEHLKRTHRSLLPIKRNSLRLALNLFVVCSGLFSIVRAINAHEYAMAAMSKENYFSKMYKDPRTISYRKGALKNLIVLYVESFETTYGDSSLFGKNLLAPLESARQKYPSFHYLQQNAASFTIGAQVATQCSVPLNVLGARVDGNSQGETIDFFLPRAKCLGQILKDFGYHNVFLQGGSLQFAGQGKFWSQHGYQEIYGAGDFEKMGHDVSGWGARDDVVLEHAKTILTRLRAKPSPFNLTIALVDTHHPDGILSERCKAEGAQTLDGIIECTSKLMAEFISHLETSGALENTRLVVIGDHLTKPNTLYDKISSYSDRQIFNLWVGKDLPKKSESDLLQYDVLPTLLDFVGISASSAQVGLGFSGFATKDNGRARERLEEMNRTLISPSPKYLALWLPE